MSDKKQIEEIVRNILENRTDIKYIPDLAFPIAKELSKHYQPKIPKGSVVLAKDEYEVLKIKKKEKHWLKLCLSIWKRVEIETRKETAREILEELWNNKFEAIVTIQNNCSKEDVENIGKAILLSIRNKLKEIAKQYEVEVEK